ncbi:hypothetical protein H4F17_18650, partial [Vibrio cholerae]
MNKELHMHTKPHYTTNLLSACRIGATNITLVAFAVSSTMLNAAPGGVTGANLWLDAGHQATRSQWSDRSSSNNNATQPFAADQPEVVSLGYNFHPTIRFTQTEFQADTADTDAQGKYVHFDINGINSTQGINTSSSIFLIGKRENIRQPFLELGNNLNRGVTGDSGAFSLFKSYTENGFPKTLPGGENELILFEASTTDLSGIVPTDSPLTIGRGTRGYEHLRGDISEIILFPRTLNPEEAKKVRTYLGIKYGVSLEQQNTQH